MKSIVLLFLMLPILSIGQIEGDSKIVLTIAKTDSLYYRIKYSLGKCDYIVREDGNRDTLRTFAARSPYLNGMTVVMVIIKGGQATLTGFYGLTQFDGWGYGHEPNQYKRIIYFKKSDSWKQLLFIAETIGYDAINFLK